MLRRVVPLLPLLLILGWWMADLQVQWRTLTEFQHGWLVVPLAAYLAWERYPGQPPLAPTGSIRMVGPVALAIAGFGLVLVAELYRWSVSRSPASSFVLSVGCALFGIAVLWSTYGGAVARWYLFPLLFLFVAVPIPKILWNPVVLGLQGFITTLNVEVLNLLGIPALRTGNLIQLPTGTVGVDEACSGVRSLQSSVMATLFISDLMLRRAGAKVFFFIAGLALAIVGNLGRSLFLALTAARRGVNAVDVVHDTAGWSVFLFTAAGIALLAWWVSRTERRLAAS